ncbi:MAG: hypothetical protein JSR82_17115 [Verrucomicrobia bacterium]|nr:hypothetical protein [Verrucomicrobiota bacterium]
MTATEIITEIRNLAPAERQAVLAFLRTLDDRQTGAELTALAQKLVGAPEAEASQLKEAIAEGFYGSRRDA